MRGIPTAGEQADLQRAGPGQFREIGIERDDLNFVVQTNDSDEEIQ